MGGVIPIVLCHIGFACIRTNIVCCILQQIDVRLFWYIKHVCKPCNCCDMGTFTCCLQ